VCVVIIVGTEICKYATTKGQDIRNHVAERVSTCIELVRLYKKIAWYGSVRNRAFSHM